MALAPNGKTRVIETAFPGLILVNIVSVWICLGTLFSLGLACAAEPGPTPAQTRPKAKSSITPLASKRLQPLFRVSPKIFSGAMPEGDAAFQEVSDLGVKTIVSVDGTKPDVALARKHGIRYIHLPFGYDGVPTNRIAELIKAAQTDPGPILVHCHHGLHRGPAAVAVLCEALEHWTPDQAVAWMKQAGTSSDYPGLYRSALEFTPPTPETVNRVGPLPEVSTTTSMVESMVAIDHSYAALKSADQQRWTRSSNAPESTWFEQAVLIREQFKELSRSEGIHSRSEEFRRSLSETQSVVERLVERLKDSKAKAEQRSEALRALGSRCVSCHRSFRN